MKIETPKEAKAAITMLSDFMSSAGWKWLEEALRENVKAWEAQLRQTAPVGEGAANVARAQGALAALEQVLQFPTMTLKAAKDVVAEHKRGSELSADFS